MSKTFCAACGEEIHQGQEAYELPNGLIICNETSCLRVAVVGKVATAGSFGINCPGCDEPLLASQEIVYTKDGIPCHDDFSCISGVAEVRYIIMGEG